jgi:hypothetical protein
MGTIEPEDDYVVILQRYTVFPTQVVKGSVVTGADCGHRGWISPQGVAFLAQYPSATTACSRCQPLDLTQDVYEVPGATQAARETFGDARVDRLKKKFNVKELPK